MILRLFGDRKDNNIKAISKYKREMMVKLGREQFKKLLEQGLSVPVALLQKDSKRTTKEHRFRYSDNNFRYDKQCSYKNRQLVFQAGNKTKCHLISYQKGGELSRKMAEAKFDRFS